MMNDTIHYRNSPTRNSVVKSLCWVAAAVLAVPLAGGAVQIQPPSEFEIDTDGLFTTGDEWSDVEPATRLNGGAFVYTATDPGPRPSRAARPPPAQLRSRGPSGAKPLA